MSDWSSVPSRRVPCRGIATYWQAHVPDRQKVEGYWHIALDSSIAELAVTTHSGDRDTVHLVHPEGGEWSLTAADKYYGHQATVDVEETSDSIIVSLSRVMSRVLYSLRKD